MKHVKKTKHSEGHCVWRFWLDDLVLPKVFPAPWVLFSFFCFNVFLVKSSSQAVWCSFGWCYCTYLSWVMFYLYSTLVYWAWNCYYWVCIVSVIYMTIGFLKYTPPPYLSVFSSVGLLMTQCNNYE
jgi:hypothetical protein